MRLGDFRFSSNIMSPAGSLQAFSLSIGDVSCYLCNRRYPHNFENALLPGASDILAPEDISCASPDTTRMLPEAAFREMGFKTILTLESIDAVLANINSTSFESPKAFLPPREEPRLTVSLKLGELSIYACKDSFQCFAGTIAELQAQMTAVSAEGLEELRSKSLPNFLSTENQEHETFYDAQSEPIRSKSMESGPVMPEVYLLDGYDWTTIGHDSNHAAEIPPGEEQAARWYTVPGPAVSSGENASESLDVSGSLSASFISNTSQSDSPKANPSLRIIDQHFPVQVMSDPLNDGDMDAPKLAGTGNPVEVQTRLIIHDMKVKVRLFDGFDWPESVAHRTRKTNGLFVIDEPACESEEVTPSVNGNMPESKKKAELMDGLLAGSPQGKSTFTDLPLPEERVKHLLTQTELRRLSRRTNTYLQFSASGIKLRMDSFVDAGSHRLKSCLNLGMEDFFFAETISNTRGPVKMMGEWLNESEHPRDSRDGLLMMKVNCTFIYSPGH